MFNKLRSLLSSRNRNVAKPVSEVLKDLASIRTASDLLAICPNNTGHNWLGIKQGTIALFPYNHICLDQNYSNSAYSAKELQEIIGEIGQLAFRKIVFRGFPPYFSSIIKALRRNCNANIYVLYAGPASELNSDNRQFAIAEMVKLTREGYIKKIGFNKKGLSHAIASIYNIDCGRYILKVADSNINVAPRQLSDTIRIGIFGGNNFNKNIHTQVLAALAIPNAEIHVLDKSKFSYLNLAHRIEGYNGYLSHQKFIEVLSSMHINLYLAFSESWGNIITESLSFGVPCLATINSGVFDFDEYLSKYLVVNDYDNIPAITQKICEVIDKYSDLSERSIQYSRILNQRADSMLEEFLG